MLWFVGAALRSLLIIGGLKRRMITLPVMTAAGKADVSRRPLLVAEVETEVTFDEIPIM
jgi:hypothetical protein